MKSTTSRCLAAFALAIGAAAPLSAQQIPFTAEQAAHGAVVYARACASCHGPRLEGGDESALKGDRFIGNWSRGGRTLDDLVFMARTTMPLGAADSLSVNDLVAVLAYILEQNGYRAGPVPLSADPDRLRELRLSAPEPGDSQSGTRIGKTQAVRS